MKKNISILLLTLTLILALLLSGCGQTSTSTPPSEDDTAATTPVENANTQNDEPEIQEDDQTSNTDTTASGPDSNEGTQNDEDSNVSEDITVIPEQPSEPEQQATIPEPEQTPEQTSQPEQATTPEPEQTPEQTSQPEQATTPEPEQTPEQTSRPEQITTSEPEYTSEPESATGQTPEFEQQPETTQTATSEPTSESEPEPDAASTSNLTLSGTDLSLRFGGGEEFTVHLYDNDTANKIAEYVGTAAWQLPIYHFDDYDGWESFQYYDIPRRYDIPDGSEPVTSERAGAVYYSHPNRIILFYQDADISTEYTPVGYVDFSQDLVDAVENNPVVPGWGNKLIFIEK